MFLAPCLDWWGGDLGSGDNFEGYLNAEKTINSRQMWAIKIFNGQEKSLPCTFIISKPFMLFVVAICGTIHNVRAIV